ncbi:hypothetical protein AAA536_07910 [Pseudomonas aeruginosa]|nr:hypothetical protein [Pseudomonas aeruginosa]
MKNIKTPPDNTADSNASSIEPEPMNDVSPLPLPVKERLCNQCLEELGLDDISTLEQNNNLICEWCIDKQAITDNFEEILEKDEPVTNNCVRITTTTHDYDKPRIKKSVKIVFTLLVVAIVAALFY